MDLRRLQRLVVDALDDVKGQDIRVFNTTGQTELFDRVIIATGTSNRQTRALAAHVRDKVKDAGGTVVSVEGGESGEWVLVDLGDAVVHIMQPAIRAYYNLEEIWGSKPVRMQVGRAGAGMGAKAAAPAAPARRLAAPHTAAA
ncbi:MAG: ribosome silencing factor, partial [Burkholderiales bacterium]|nr:ribosome silencing factor [Burkholderiales bacterium]